MIVQMNEPDSVEPNESAKVLGQLHTTPRQIDWKIKKDE